MEFPAVKVCMLADSNYVLPANFKNIICQWLSCVCVCVCVSNVSGWINLKLCALYLPWSHSSAYSLEILLSCCSRCHRISPPSSWGKRSMEDDLGYCMLTRRIHCNKVCDVLIDNYMVEFECQSFYTVWNMFPLFVAEFLDYSCL